MSNITTKPEVLFIAFESEKKYEIWIFFETNEFKKLTLFIYLFIYLFTYLFFTKQKT